MIEQDNNIPSSPKEDLAEMVELIRLMLADSPYPVQSEDFPEVDRRRPSAA